MGPVAVATWFRHVACLATPNLKTGIFVFGRYSGEEPAQETRARLQYGHIRILTYIYIHKYIYIYAYMHICIYIYMYICTRARARVCVCVQPCDPRENFFSTFLCSHVYKQGAEAHTDSSANKAGQYVVRISLGTLSDVPAKGGQDPYPPKKSGPFLFSFS